MYSSSSLIDFRCAKKYLKNKESYVVVPWVMNINGYHNNVNHHKDNNIYSTNTHSNKSKSVVQLPVWS